MGKSFRAKKNAENSPNRTGAKPKTIALSSNTIPPTVKALQRQLHLKQANNRSSRAAPLGAVLQPWFETHVNRPGKQLEHVAEVWMTLLPPRLLSQTRLLSLTRQVLCVAVPNATIRCELDMLLRQGLQRQIQEQARGAVYRIKTVTDAAACQ